MKKIIVLAAAVGLLSACGQMPGPDAREQQAINAEKAAESVKRTGNSEIDNIKRRLELTSNPGQIGFILLLNEMGQPVMYSSVKGKITSGGKRLTPPTQEWTVYGNNQLGPAPSDEGTWGDSSPYVFWWDVNGQYHQWNGKYLYSDKPFRISVKPIVITNTSE